MAKPTPSFTIDDLLAQIKPEEAEDGFTIKELCIEAGFVPIKANLSRVRRAVRDLRVLGHWEYVGKKLVIDEDTGIRSWHMAHKPKKK